MVIVRSALASDAEVILAFYQQIGSETNNLSYGEEGVSVSVADEGNSLSEIQKSKTSHFLVTEEAGEVVGMCNCSAFRKKRLAYRVEIGIAVKKAYWNQGIGRQLLTRLIAAAQQSGLKVLSLEVRSDNNRAIHLHDGLGLQKVGTFRHFMEIDDQAIDFDIMELLLEKK